MAELLFLPVELADAAPAAKGEAVRAARVAVAGKAAPLALLLGDAGRLSVAPAGAVEAGEVLAALRTPGPSADVFCWLRPLAPALRLNGAAPLPLAAVRPGDLLACGARAWFVTAEHRAEPAPAPAELAERPCPVCGGALKLAPVCRCPCGRYYHLEAPAAGAEGDKLNCFLAAPCGLCSREPTLDPVLLPEPPDKLFGFVGWAGHAEEART